MALPGPLVPQCQAMGHSVMYCTIPYHRMIPSSFWLLLHHSFIAIKHLSLGVNFWPAAQIFHHHLGTAAEGHAGGVNCDRERQQRKISWRPRWQWQMLAICTGQVCTRNNQSMERCTSAQCLDKKFYQYHEKNAGHLSCKRWVDLFYRHTKSQTADDKAGPLLKLHILAAAG